jgi:AraC-like DNA-binding protein
MSSIQFWQHPASLRLAMVQSRLLPSSTHFRHHDHGFYELGFVLSGRCRWIFARRPQRVRAGEFILVPPGQSHHELIGPGECARLAWVGFDLTGPDVSVPAWSLRPVSAGPWAAELARLLETVSAENQSSDLGSRERRQLALQEILILVCRAAGRPATRGPRPPEKRSAQVARSAAHYLTANLDRPLSVQAVARYHSLGAPHFSVVFRRHHGVTPREFLHRSRIARARELLAGDGRLVKEIAAICGYADAAHFCRRFKSATGLTPKQFRRRQRNRA